MSPSVADIPDLAAETTNDNNDVASIHQPNPSIVHVRRSTRAHRPPNFLQEYHCNLLTNNDTSLSLAPYSLSKYLSYDRLTDTQRHFVLNVSVSYEPSFFH